MTDIDNPRKYKYDIALLSNIITRDNAVLIGTYNNLNSQTIINYNCKCNNNCNKKFIYLVYNTGAFCKTCVNTIKSKKIKETNLTRYGVENVSQNNDIKNKKNDTYMEHYGMHPKKVKEVNDKYKKTCLEKYGVDNVSKVKEIKDKIKNVFTEKYNGHPMYNDEIKNKITENFITKYGDHPNRTADIKEKTKITFLHKFGGYPTQHPDIIEKRKQTCLQKYGVEHPSQCIEVNKKNQLNSKKYKKYTLPSGKIINIQGYENYAIDELLKLYSEEDIISDRKDIPRIQYKHQEKNKYYFPDIFVPKENKIIEVKSEWTYKRNYNLELKADATKLAGYIYEIWVYNRKGNRINTIL
jgi:hypothetical protein